MKTDTGRFEYVSGRSSVHNSTVINVAQTVATNYADASRTVRYVPMKWNGYNYSQLRRTMTQENSACTECYKCALLLCIWTQASVPYCGLEPVLRYFTLFKLGSGMDLGPTDLQYALSRQEQYTTRATNSRYLHNLACCSQARNGTSWGDTHQEMQQRPNACNTA